jgi:predicted transcriptional regulator YdeE
MTTKYFDRPPLRIDRPDVGVMERSTVDDLAHIQQIWPAFENLVGVHGRKMYAYVDLERNTYTVCTPVLPMDEPDHFGLTVGTLPGGRYLRGRLTGESSDIYAVIGDAMTELRAMAVVDPTRPLVEYYRRHNQVELWVPIAVA